MGGVGGGTILHYSCMKILVIIHINENQRQLASHTRMTYRVLQSPDNHNGVTLTTYQQPCIAPWKPPDGW